jgi:hypothetical protein
LKITIIWYNEFFNGKGLKANHMIFVSLFHSTAGKTGPWFSLFTLFSSTNKTDPGTPLKFVESGVKHQT